MKKIKFLALLFMASTTASVNGQVLIGENATNTPHVGAILELESTNKGLLLPNVALHDAEILTVGSLTANSDETAKGMVVYNPYPYACDGKGIYVWDGSKWVGVYTQGLVIADATYYAPDPNKTVAIPTASGDLTFLTYNLGANPALTPKQQMAYRSSASPSYEDVTVLGGLFQWGRKDYAHASRYNKTDKPDHFMTEHTYYTSYNPDTDHQFVWGKNLNTNSDWITPVSNSNLWGNGGNLAEQTNDNYSSFTPSATNNVNDPCPTGFRVPTQHEWSLIIGQNATNASNTTEDDHFSFPASDVSFTNARNPDITWVRVKNGKTITEPSWSSPADDSGFAIYNTQAWNNYTIIEGVDLTTEDAPNPLMFLPAAGYRSFESCGYNTLGGYYWSNIGAGGLSRYMYFKEPCNLFATGNSNRAFGFSVRCVSESN
ncbi:MAG: hypothetical protein LBS25_02210 [Candidatus Symbiothrix sp.]|nr:hypothetical protein [Candidatus Symbiothrix sp.]